MVDGCELFSVLIAKVLVLKQWVNLEHPSAEGTQSISPSRRNGSSCWPSNPWPEFERQSPMITLLYATPSGRGLAPTVRCPPISVVS